MAEVSVENDKLICIYDQQFASADNKIGQSITNGFGVAINGSMDDIPYDLILTLNEKMLNGWHPSKNSVKLPHNYRGCVVYTFEECRSDKSVFDCDGGFYNYEYEGNPVSLARTFAGEARVNQAGTGFIISKTKTGLYTPQQAPPPKIPKTPKPMIRDK